MSGIAEFTIAIEFAEELQTTGGCTHKGFAHQPMCLAKYEIDQINRFDPELAKELKSYGVQIEKMTIPDFDYIGTKAHELRSQIALKANDESKFLHKHAIARRMTKTMVVSSSSGQKHVINTCRNIFGHAAKEY